MPRALVFVVILILGRMYMAQETQKQEVRTEKPDPGKALKVQTSCSRINLGTSVAEVSWMGTKAGTTRDQSAAATQLEVTTVKDGFLSGASVTVWPSSAKARENLSLTDHRLDPLRSLRIAPPDRAHGILAASKPENAITIQNLAPGVNYYWRVSTKTDGDLIPSSVVMTTGPVCPVDYRKK